MEKPIFTSFSKIKLPFYTRRALQILASILAYVKAHYRHYVDIGIDEFHCDFFDNCYIVQGINNQVIFIVNNDYYTTLPNGNRSPNPWTVRSRSEFYAWLSNLILNYANYITKEEMWPDYIFTSKCHTKNNYILRHLSRTVSGCPVTLLELYAIWNETMHHPLPAAFVKESYIQRAIYGQPIENSQIMEMVQKRRKQLLEQYNSGVNVINNVAETEKAKLKAEHDAKMKELQVQLDLIL